MRPLSGRNLDRFSRANAAGSSDHHLQSVQAPTTLSTLLSLDSTKNANASDLLCQWRAATKRLNGISTPPLGLSVRT